MTDDRPTGWRRSAVGEEVSAVLDGADVSERVRAAIAHALVDQDGLTAYVNALADRYATDRDRRSGPPLPAALDPQRRWTLHLTYAAHDLDEARDRAVIYTEGLATLRPELASTATMLSRADAWNHVEPIFCGQLGPDGEVCADVTGHPGFHRAAGIDGLRWGDGDRDTSGTGQ